MTKDLNDSPQEYDIDSEKLHSFLKSYCNVSDKYDDIHRKASILYMLVEIHYECRYDESMIMDVMNLVINHLYSQCVKENELFEECNSIRREMLGISLN